MALQLLAETTALYVSGMPQLLREIWSHLYPASPAPRYRVFSARFDGTHSEFSASVYLRTPATPYHDGRVYVYSSSITTQVTRAIQEVADDAIILLRTQDPIMRMCTRYAHFPRLDPSNGDILFPNPGDPSSELTNLLRYTFYLHKYLHDTLTQLSALRVSVAETEAARASRNGAVPRALPIPAHLAGGTLAQVRRELAPGSAARTVPFRDSHATRRAVRRVIPHSPEPRFQRRRLDPDPPPPAHSPGSSVSSIDTGEGRIDSVAPAARTEMEF